MVSGPKYRLICVCGCVCVCIIYACGTLLDPACTIAITCVSFRYHLARYSKQKHLLIMPHTPVKLYKVNAEEVCFHFI